MFGHDRCSSCGYWCVIELDRSTDKLDWVAAVGSFHLKNHVVCKRLFVAHHFKHGLDRRPLATIRFELFAPVLKGLHGKSRLDDLARGLPVLHESFNRCETLIIYELGPIDVLEKASNMRCRAECAHIYRTAIRGPVVPHERIASVTARGGHTVAGSLVIIQCVIQRRARGPPSRAQE